MKLSGKNILIRILFRKFVTSLVATIPAPAPRTLIAGRSECSVVTGRAHEIFVIYANNVSCVCVREPQ